MNLTHKNIFTFAIDAWGLNGSDLAKHLECNKSTINRVLNGETATFNRNNKFIFEKLFDPLVEGSPVYGENEKYLLELMNEVIERAGFGEVAKAVKHDSYKSFMMGLLRVARKSDSQKNEPQTNKKTPEPTLPLENTFGEESKITVVGNEIEKCDAFLSKSEKYESALKEFERAIFDYQFSEFVNSEPLLEFTAKSESDVEKLKTEYIAYKNRMRDSSKKTYGEWSENAKYFDYSQDEELPYTHKLLTRTLMRMSERLVDVLITKILPALEDLDFYLYDDILEFKNKLKAYIVFLNKHLKDEGEHLIYGIESVVYRKKEVEENLSEKEFKDILAENKIIFDKPILSIENLYIDEAAFNTEPGDEKSSLMAFHAATRRYRAEIKSLYREISE